MYRLLAFLCFWASVAAFRTIEFKNCKPSSGTFTCKIKAVEVNGCLNPSSWVDMGGTVVEYQPEDVKSPCRIDKGSTLNFSISFEPGFSVNTLRSQFTLPQVSECWSGPETCPLADVPVSACELTKCPLEAGRQQRIETSLQINPNVPPRSVNDRKIYQMRWRMWNNKNKKHNCCFNVPIQY